MQIPLSKGQEAEVTSSPCACYLGKDLGRVRWLLDPEDSKVWLLANTHLAGRMGKEKGGLPEWEALRADQEHGAA